MPKRHNRFKDQIGIEQQVPVKKVRVLDSEESEDLVFENEVLRDEIERLERVIVEQELETNYFQNKSRKLQHEVDHLVKTNEYLRDKLKDREQEKLDNMRFIRDHPGFLEIT